MSFTARTRFPQASLALLAAVCMLGGLLTGGPGTATAAAAGADPGRTDYSVSGEHIVWLEPDNSGVKQVHMLNQASGAESVLTSDGSAKDAPSAGGGIAVWADKGSEPESSLNWDIYSADPASGTRTKLNKQTGPYGNPTTDGTGVVWYERTNYGTMIYHDLATGVEADLGEGRFPVLAGGSVVYKNARDGGISLLDLGSGVRRPLVSLGGASYVDWFVFNGTHVLYRQANGAAESKYVLLSIKDLAAEPVDLTEMKTSAAQYTFMSIGDGQAVFQIEEEGVPALKQVNLATAEVSTLPAIAAGSKLIGISGGKLLYSNKNDYIESIDLGTGSTEQPGTEEPGTEEPGTEQPGTEQPGTSPGSSSSSNAGIPVVTGTKDSQIIGAAGGILSAADGWARLEIAAGTFPDNTTVSLAQAELETQVLTDNNGHTLRKAGSAWQVQASAPFQQPSLLVIRYPQESLWTAEREKLGIYSYDPVAASWSYIGGVTAAEEGYVHAKISEPGLYAVMLRERDFADMASHWAKHQVEVLAARGIVDGRAPSVYAPKATLTRAEFTKLLAAALQLQPLQSETPTFRDVSAASWSYGWVEAAAAAGIVTGDGGLFRGNDPLTREQMTAMLMRAIEKTAAIADSADANKLEAGLQAFKDNGSISAWARSSVAAAIDRKLVQGDGQLLHPKQSSTRAEAAVIIYKLLAELKLL